MPTRYRTLLAYRFPPNPAEPKGFIQGFAAEWDALLCSNAKAKELCRWNAECKVKNKIDVLNDIHGTDHVFDPARVLVTKADRAKVTPEELKQLQADWKISLRAPMNGAV